MADRQCWLPRPDGILIGTQNFGVAFEDSTYFQNYGSSTHSLGSGSLTFFDPLSGPLSGGTTFSPFAVVNLLPDVWFGDVRGTASLPGSAPTSLSIISPAGAAPGPVDLKAIFPNGTASYAAQAFSYGPYSQHMVYSGSAPQGGANATVTGFGLPVDSSTGSVTVGGSAATITSTVGQYPPFTGESVPSTYLNFTVPAGRPGTADLQVTTPSDTGSLPGAIFYASSVNDYSFAGTGSALVYDRGRKQTYVITQNSVLVFSLTRVPFQCRQYMERMG